MIYRAASTIQRTVHNDAKKDTEPLNACHFAYNPLTII